MKDMGVVQGSEAQAKPLIVDKDTVYIHTDIEKVEGKEFNGRKIENLYSYHEIQYGKDEYIQMLAEQNETLEQQLTDTQLALCDVYEMLE